jgi:hypothetical protein
MGADASQLALVDDQIFGADRLTGEIAFENLPPISLSLNMCSVSGWSGALMVTSWQTLTKDSTFGWNVKGLSRDGLPG